MRGRAKFSLTSLRLVTVALAFTFAPVAVRPALAEPAAPAASAPIDTSGGWRRVAFPTTLVLAGVGLVGGVGFWLRENQRTDAFNSYMVSSPQNRCNVVTASGPCQELLDQSRSASRLSTISFALAGSMAVAALVIKLTEPEPAREFARRSGGTGTDSMRLACAPGLGPSATCALAF